MTLVSLRKPEPSDRAGSIPQRLERIDGEPVLNIFVLGTAGAGKTVFLTSLWNFLSVMDRERNFYITCPNHDHEQILRHQYKTLIDPKAPWFPGSYEIGEFLFRTYYKMPGGQDLSLFRIWYFDFPGGFLSAPWQTADNFSEDGAHAFSVEGAAAKAHCVLALLDGKKIFNLLEKVEVPRLESIYYDLDELVYILHKCVGRPIHFAITKADLLDKQKHPLARIKSELMEHDGLKKIVDLQKPSPMYIIPVSAVGRNFATMDLSSGQIKKRHDGILRPFNMDTCLCLTLVDQVKELAKSRDAVMRGDLRKKLFIVKAVLVILSVRPKRS